MIERYSVSCTPSQSGLLREADYVDADDCERRLPGLTYPPSQTPKGISKLDPLEEYGEMYGDYVGVIMALYRDLIFRSSKGSGIA